MTNGTDETATRRTGARKALGNARSSTLRTVESAGENPLALLAGGVALGVLIGMLLPRPQREREALAGVGKKLADGATKAAKAAREAGKAELEAVLPDADATKDRVVQLFGSVLNAARDANKKG